MKTRRSEICPAGCGNKIFPGDVVCIRCMAAVRVDNAELLRDWASRKLDHTVLNAYLRGRIVGKAKRLIDERMATRVEITPQGREALKCSQQGTATTRRHSKKGAGA